jgi:hypothetical protein
MLRGHYGIGWMIAAWAALAVALAAAIAMAAWFGPMLAQRMAGG